VVVLVPGFNVDDVLHRCFSKLAWLEEAWYYWVVAEELTWNRDYGRATEYVRKSLQWLRRIILNNEAEGSLRKHIEQLMREIESINGVSVSNEGRVLELTLKFRHMFYRHLAECIVEEATAVATLIQPPQGPVKEVE
jgi:hypothetical protein